MKSFFYFFISLGISETSQYSFCNQNIETIKHLFCHYFVAKVLWDGLNTFFEKPLSLHNLNKLTPFFGFTEKHLDNTILQSLLLLVLQMYLYRSGSYRFVCVKSLIEIKQINCLEKKIPEANANKDKSYLLKLNKIDNQLTLYNSHFPLTK